MTTPTRWTHPDTGQEIRWYGLPSQAPAPDQALSLEHRPAVVETAEYKYLAAEMAAAPEHEARHAAVGMVLGFRPIEARADLPEDHIAGCVRFDFAGETWDPVRRAEYAAVLLAGPVGEKTGAPAWPLDDGKANAGSDEAALAQVVADLGLSERQYRSLVDIARMLVDDGGVKRATGRIATLLDLGVTLDERMLSDLNRSAWKSYTNETQADEALDPIEIPEPVDPEHAKLVAEHRDRMITYMRDASEYYDAQALRRRADEVTQGLGL